MGVGILLAFAFVLLVLFGILAPVLSYFFRFEPSASSLPTFVPLLVVVCAFAFYFGGMAASYKARDRHVLHGVLVAPVAFVISPVANLLTGQSPFPGVNSVPLALLAVFFLVVSAAASYVGARRGAALYAHNERFLNRRRSRRSG